MLDALPWPAITAASGGWLLLGAFVVALIRGNLVPRQTLQDALDDRDEWRAESRIKDQQIAEKDTQLGHMAEVGRNVLAIMHSIKQYPHRDEVT